MRGLDGIEDRAALYFRWQRIKPISLYTTPGKIPPKKS